MKVLFTGFFPRFSIHFVTELDYVEKHLAQGDEVSFVTCNAELNTCECNRLHELAYCADCIGRRQDGLSRLSRPVRELSLTEPIVVPRLIPKNLSSVEALKALKMDNFDYGEAVYSSLIDRCLSTEPDIKANFAVIENMAADSYRVWQRARRLLRQKRFDRVYIFNGRFNNPRAWVRACQEVGVPFYTHERSMTLGRVFRIENALIHDPTHYLGRIQEFLRKSWGDPNVAQQGIDFFEERPKGKLSGWRSFVTGQNPEELPQTWDPARRNFAFFASTEREFVGVKQFTPKGIYDSQVEALKDISRRVSEADRSICIYLRIHPNSINEKVRWWDREEIASLPNIEVLPPESKVSSYALLNAVEKVLCFRSSMGIEAAYWGKPSIILTWAFYAGLDAVYEPKDRDDVLALVLGKLPPKPRENAVKYGAFLRCGGDLLEYSKPQDAYSLIFKDAPLMVHPAVDKWATEVAKRPGNAPGMKTIWGMMDALRFAFLRLTLGGRFLPPPPLLKRPRPKRKRTQPAPRAVS